ncbi:MAG: methyltransferase domain-containing protein [Sphingobacteriia bacterium]|nr:methyltransferase domain-containing protein [Sphingobacteriia bacterium]
MMKDNLIKLINTENEIIVENNNTTKSYNLYFEKNNGISLYNKRFKSQKLTYSEYNIVVRTCLSVIKNIKKKTHSYPNKLSVLDFGCGDGRYFKAFVKVANILKSKGIILELINYDPSYIGLQCYQNELMNIGFKLNSSVNLHQIQEDSFKGYEVSTLLKDNLKVKFIHGNANDDSKYIMELLGGENSVDLIFCMFGVLSHIPMQTARIDILTIFNQMVNIWGKVVVSVPAYKDFKKELITYDQLRREKNVLDTHKNPLSFIDYKGILGSVSEEGDIYYCRYDDEKAIRIYYNLYNFNRFKNDLKNSGLSINSLNILNFWHPSKVAGRVILSISDYLISFILSRICKIFKNSVNFTSYIVSICSKDTNDDKKTPY